MGGSGVLGLCSVQDTGMDSFEYRRENTHRRTPPRPVSPSCTVFVSNVSGIACLYVSTYVCMYVRMYTYFTYVCVVLMYVSVYGQGICAHSVV